MGLTLAFSLVAGEYTAFLREQLCVTRSPARNPMTMKTTAVTTTLTEIASSVDRVGGGTVRVTGEPNKNKNIKLSREFQQWEGITQQKYCKCTIIMIRGLFIIVHACASLFILLMHTYKYIYTSIEPGQDPRDQSCYK